MLIDVGGTRINAQVEGDGRPVVFVHGFACTHAVWDPVVSALAGRYRTVAVDLRGFGASDTFEGPVTLAELAGDIAAVIGHLGIEGAIVAGHSMGGMVVQHMYASTPAPVAALVLCGTTSQANTSYVEASAMLRQLVEGGGPAALAAALGPGLFGEAYREAHPDEVEAFAATIERCHPGVLCSALDVAMSFDLSHQLQRIDVPTAVVVGDGDPFLEDCRRMAAAVAGALFRELPGIGHMEPIEAPDAVVAAIDLVAARS